MDAAHLRRGGQTANARWGNSAAILTGDYLFARASDIVADLGPECVRIQARTFSRLVQGQLSETVGPGECEPVSHYLAVVADKTGSLIATSAQLGARMSGAGEKAERLLAAFGERIGVAFQLSDDVLDVASEATQSGKAPGTDLRAGVPTLPVLLALRADDAAAGFLRRLLDSDLSDDDVLAEALQVLRGSPAMATARREVAERAETARRLLDPLPDIPARAALAALCDLVVSRTG
jgi:heptaprenyl diphosphate synthase